MIKVIKQDNMGWACCTNEEKKMLMERNDLPVIGVDWG
jgi:hypothetical protein